MRRSALLFALAAGLGCLGGCEGVEEPEPEPEPEAVTGESDVQDSAASEAAGDNSSRREPDQREEVGTWLVSAWEEEGVEVAITGLNGSDPLVFGGGCEEGRTTFSVMDNRTFQVQKDTGNAAISQWRSIAERNELPGTRELAERVAAACGWQL